MSLLTEIKLHKLTEVAQLKQQVPLVALRQLAESCPPVPALAAALEQRRAAAHHPALIAEVKLASPSRGVLHTRFSPLELAEIYINNGAAALSILTDQRYFAGSLATLTAVSRLAASRSTPIPLLRKDFILDPYQIYEARVAGASAVLLIAAFLDPTQLSDLHQLCLSLGMQALFEVHTANELDLVLDCQPELIGVNSRNLHTFQTDLATAFQLRAHIPNHLCTIAESGIRSILDLTALGDAGFHAVLVGEALVIAADIPAQVAAFSRQPQSVASASHP